MRGRDRFTHSEAEQIRLLLRAKNRASRSEQKSIRGKLRKLGFYITDFDFSPGFSLPDFENLIRLGLVTVVEGQVVVLNEPDSTIRATGHSKDEAYVIDLCDSVLQVRARRQHQFDFLRGDAGTRLPVDAYYESLNLVVEYRECQHTEEVFFFDKPDRMTVSGVHRGEQRKLYDERRRLVLPEKGIHLIEFSYLDFAHKLNKRLVRNHEQDVRVVRSRLLKYIKD